MYTNRNLTENACFQFYNLEKKRGKNIDNKDNSSRHTFALNYSLYFILGLNE